MRPLLRALSTLLLAPILTTSAAHAQYSIDKVVFHNAAPYTDAELLASSGLAPGQFLTHNSLANAAQHLLDTGLFSDAEVALSGQGKARTVVVDLKPIPLSKLLPTSFENLVWFTPEELTTGIHAHVPLYRGVASDAGNFPDAIQSALQQMLTEKGITATLSNTIVEPTTEHPIRVVDFKIEQPSILIAKVTCTLSFLPNASASYDKSGLETYLASLAGKSYNEGLSDVTLEDRLLNPWLEMGFITAKLDDIHRTPTTSSRGVDVTYTAHLDAGAMYTVKSLTWQATPIYTDADFARDAKLHPGQIANSRILANTEAPILTAYLLQGYMDVYILPHPILDTTAHTVAYTLEPIPGDIYRLHSINATGLSPDAQKAFNADWQLKPGDPYSDLAVNAFLIKHVAQPLFRTYDPAFRAVADPQTHLVDLTLTFTPNGSKVY
jgi:outer membrane protein assembly factor BamA